MFSSSACSHRAGKNCFSFSALGEAGKLTAAFKDWGKVEKVKKNEQLQVKTKEETERSERETEQDLKRTAFSSSEVIHPDSSSGAEDNCLALTAP